MVTKDKLKIKIIDFGSCQDLAGTPFAEHFEKKRKEEKRQRPHFKNFVGTPNYMAPECVRNLDTGPETDIWSLGCLLHNLYVGFSPFTGKSEYLIFRKSLKLLYNKEEAVIPKEAREIIEGCLKLDRKERISIEEIKKSSYFKGVDKNKPGFPGLKEICFKKLKTQPKTAFSKVKELSRKIEQLRQRIDPNRDCEGERKELGETDTERIKRRTEFEEYFSEFSEKILETSQEWRGRLELLKRQVLHDLFDEFFEEIDELDSDSDN